MKQILKIKREDGSSVRITVSFSCFETPSYAVNVEHCQPGKRKFTLVDVTQNILWMRLPIGSPERDKFLLDRQLEFATEEEITWAKMDLWENLKPV